MRDDTAFTPFDTSTGESYRNGLHRIFQIDADNLTQPMPLGEDGGRGRETAVISLHYVEVSHSGSIIDFKRVYQAMTLQKCFQVRCEKMHVNDN